MTIARGQSNTQAERKVVLQGFYEQIETLQQSLSNQETSIKAKLYDIVSNKCLNKEEQDCHKTPLLNTLEDIENSHMRIRNSILVGIYSFWEVALYDIISTHLFNTASLGNTDLQKTFAGKSKVGNYLNQIYGDNIPKASLILDGAIRDLRNYIVHGKLTSNKKASIKALEMSNPELCIKFVCGECFLTDYLGLHRLLGIITDELNNAEDALKQKLI